MRPRVIVIATLILSGVLFLVNLFVAVLSGSRTVFSQAIYSITDLVGGGLIFWGYLVSQRPPDHVHPFGHGKERFFWSFTGGLVTFTVSGLIVLVGGFQGVAAPHPLDHLQAALTVVGATLALSLVGIYITLRELRTSKQTLSTFLDSPYSGLKTIFYQDLVSVFGSLVAFVGLALIYQTGFVLLDGITAMGVGVLLIATGLVLAAESRELLVGKAISANDARQILSLVERDPRVRQVRGLQSMMLGPEDILVALRVNFQDGLNTDQIESAIDGVALSLRQTYPALRHLVIEPES